jgi:hypothetical protein
MILPEVNPTSHVFGINLAAVCLSLLSIGGRKKASLAVIRNTGFLIYLFQVTCYPTLSHILEIL